MSFGLSQDGLNRLVVNGEIQKCGVVIMGDAKGEATDQGLAFFRNLISSRYVKIPKNYTSWKDAYVFVTVLFTEKDFFEVDASDPRSVPMIQGLVSYVFARRGSPCFLVKKQDSAKDEFAYRDSNLIKQFFIEQFDPEGGEGTVFFEDVDRIADDRCSFLVFKIIESGAKVLFLRVAGGGLSLHSCDIDLLADEAPDHSREMMWVLQALSSEPEFEDIELPAPRAQGFGKKSQSNNDGCERAKILKPRILPINPVRIDHGGTHASPRPHDRRGHWRRKPKGDTNDLIWVSPAKIGLKNEQH